MRDKAPDRGRFACQARAFEGCLRRLVGIDRPLPVGAHLVLVSGTLVARGVG
jgi:hypothetical protein